MSNYKVLYFHKPNWEGMDLFPDVSVPLLWPTNVFSVLVAAYPQRQLNFFEIGILRLLRLNSCNVEILCKQTCLRDGFIRLILRRLRDQGFVRDFHLTEQGLDLLNETMAEQPVTRNVFVFRDCLSKKFYPIIASKLEIQHGSARDGDVFFRPSKSSRKISAIPAHQACNRLPPPTQSDVMEIIHDFNVLSLSHTVNSSSVYNESPEHIEICGEKPDFVWLYSDARLGRKNHRIYVSDPFWEQDSVILGENMNCSELNHIAMDLKQRGVTVTGELPLENNKIDHFESLGFLLRPLNEEKDPSAPLPLLSDSDRMERLSDYYYAIEQAFKKMLDEYDYKNLIDSLRGIDDNTIQGVLMNLAVDKGMPPHYRPPSDVIKSSKISPWLKQDFSLKQFFLFSGSRLQECLTGEANLRFWLGLALLVDKKRPLPSLRRLFKKEFLQFIIYLVAFRNSEYHGDISKVLPTMPQLESCLKKTRDIVDCLLPELNISSLAYNEMSGLDTKTRDERYYKAESDLTHQLGYEKMRKLPSKLREKLIQIKFHMIGKHKNYIFSNIMIIEHLMFKIAHAERLPDIPGSEVLQRAQSHFPQLPHIFWEINPRKLTNTIAGIPQSFRASLLCLMAFCEKHKGFFNADRLQYLECVLHLRTHNWQECVQSKPFSEIEKIGEQTIAFTTAIIEEYHYEED